MSGLGFHNCKEHYAYQTDDCPYCRIEELEATVKKQAETYQEYTKKLVRKGERIEELEAAIRDALFSPHYSSFTNAMAEVLAKAPKEQDNE